MTTPSGASGAPRRGPRQATHKVSSEAVEQARAWCDWFDALTPEEQQAWHADLAETVRNAPSEATP